MTSKNGLRFHGFSLFGLPDRRLRTTRNGHAWLEGRLADEVPWRIFTCLQTVQTSQ